MLKQICDLRVTTIHSFYGTGCQVSTVFQVQLLGVLCIDGFRGLQNCLLCKILMPNYYERSAKRGASSSVV